MASCSLWLVVVLWLQGSCVCRRGSEAGSVALDKYNWADYITPHSIALVEFHNGTRSTQFAHAAKLLRDIMPLGSVDVRRDLKLAAKWGINAFPTFRLFKNGFPEVYSIEEHSVKEIVYHCLEELDTFAQRTEVKVEIGGQADPAASFLQEEEDETETEQEYADPTLDEDVNSVPVEILGSAMEVNNLLQLEDVLVLGFFSDDEEGQADFKTFQECSELLSNEYPFAAVTNPELLEKFNISAVPMVMMYKGHGEEVLAFEAAMQLQPLYDWIKSHGFIVLMEVDASNMEQRLLDEVPSVLVFVDKANAATTDEALDIMRKTSPIFKDDLDFFFADGLKMQQLMKSLAAPTHILPAFVLFDPVEQHRYIMPQKQPTTQQLAVWIENYLDGHLQPTIKTEAEAETCEKGAAGCPHIRRITAATFDSLVLDSSRDVLVQYHTPWCPHCQQLWPVLEKLAAAVAHLPSIVVGSLDIDANDMHPEYEVSSVPTLMLFSRAHKHQPIPFEGARTTAALLKFLQSYGSLPLGAYTDIEHLEGQQQLQAKHAKLKSAFKQAQANKQ